jgi:outer membrane murein-binding lipoprotein Lpp
VTRVVLTLLLLSALPVEAQDRDAAIRIMREVAAACPRAYLNAHADHNTHPERLDYIVLAAQALKRFDPQFGMNGKRGNANDPSADAIAYGAGRNVLIVDVIRAAGEHGNNLDAIGWGDVTEASRPNGGIYVDPDRHSPRVACEAGGGTTNPPPPPPPPPLPTVDLSAVLAKIDALASQVSRLSADVNRSHAAAETDAEAFASELAVTKDELAQTKAELTNLILRMEQGFVIDANVRYLGALKGTVKLPKD